MIGFSSGLNNAGSSNIFIGPYSGRRQTAANNVLLIDGVDRSSTANELIESLLYGTTHATAASQTLRINAQTEIGNTTTRQPLVVRGDLTVDGSTTLGDNAADITTINAEYTLPQVDGATGDIIATDGANTATFKTPTVDIPIVLTSYEPIPARASESNIHGAFIKLDDAASMDSVTPFNVADKGIGKVVIAIIAGADTVGDITITGTSVNRNTGATTGSDTSVITLTGVTTDSTTTDTNSNLVHAFTKAYITDKWFVGVVTISTSDVDISDMDIYHISFEQFNDQPSLILNTFDINLQTTATNAQFDAYLFDIHVTGDECDIESHADLHIGSGGETALVDEYWRLRRGGIDHPFNGTTDGIWVDLHYSTSPARIEDVTVKVWATCSQPLTLN
jgi:hypothetical protein